MQKLAEKINRVRLALGLSGVFLAAYLAQVSFSVVVLLLALYFYSIRNGVFGANLKTPYLLLIFLLIYAPSYFILRNNLPIYFIPFFPAAMLIALLFTNLQAALLLSLALAISLASISNNLGVVLLILFLTSAIVSSSLVKQARKRNRILQAGIITGAIQLFLVFLAKDFWQSPYTLWENLYFLLNGIIYSVIVLGVLPIFEYLFGAILVQSPTSVFWN